MCSSVSHFVIIESGMCLLYLSTFLFSYPITEDVA